MAQIIVPLTAYDSLQTAGGNFQFGEGAWTGVIESTEVRELPAAQDGSPFAGYTTTDGERLSIRLTSNQPMEGQDEAGNRKYFVDLVLKDGDETVETIDTAARDVAAWQLQKSALLVASLAAALGAVERDDTTVAVADGFLDALKEGQFNGTQVGYVIRHRSPKKGANAGKIYDEIAYFMAA